MSHKAPGDDGARARGVTARGPLPRRYFLDRRDRERILRTCMRPHAEMRTRARAQTALGRFPIILRIIGCVSRGARMRRERTPALDGDIADGYAVASYIGNKWLLKWNSETGKIVSISVTRRCAELPFYGKVSDVKLL